MKSSVFIPLKFPSLNDYVRECRGNMYKAQKTKGDIETYVCLFVQTMPVFTRPVRVSFEWHEGNRKRDLDNVAFAKKFVLDALVKAGRLKGDSQRYVKEFHDAFVVRPGGDFGLSLTVEEIGE